VIEFYAKASEAMLGIIIALALLFLLTVYIGDAVGAFTLGLVIMVLGWVLWGERKKGEGEQSYLVPIVALRANGAVGFWRAVQW
jgi:hypothetical protein